MTDQTWTCSERRKRRFHKLAREGYACGDAAACPYLLSSDVADAWIIGARWRQLGRDCPRRLHKSTGYTWRIDGALYRIDGDKIVHAEPATEPTAQGAQLMLGGDTIAQPLTERDLIARQMAAPLKGGSKPLDFGLFDDNARRQADLLD